MRIYYIPKDAGTGVFVASHDDAQNVPESMYGPNVKSFSVEDMKYVVRIGNLPPNETLDTRLIQIPAVSLSDLKKAATATAFTALTNAAETVMANYTQAEMLSWATKDIAARAYLAGETLTDTQNTLLEAELSSTAGSTDLKTLCTEIVAKAEAFAKISGTLAGLRQTVLASIAAAQNSDSINAALVDLTTALAKIST